MYYFYNICCRHESKKKRTLCSFITALWGLWESLTTGLLALLARRRTCWLTQSRPESTGPDSQLKFLFHSMAPATLLYFLLKAKHPKSRWHFSTISSFITMAFQGLFRVSVPFHLHTRHPTFSDCTLASQCLPFLPHRYPSDLVQWPLWWPGQYSGEPQNAPAI